jgi:hypothetical protein
MNPKFWERVIGMDCTKELLEALTAPFSSQEISWKVKSARKGRNGGYSLLVLPYIGSRTVMERLDQVCGALWQSNFHKITVQGKEAFQCRLSLKIDNEWITRTDGAEASDIESVKGGHSNALKRAGVQWGIGRYMYELPTFWVDLKDRGVHRVYGKFKVNGEQVSIAGYYDTPQLPEWALPAGEKPKKKGQQHRESQEQSQQNQGQQKPSNQKKQDLSEEERHKNALKFVNQSINFLEIPLEYIPGLLKRASGSTVPYEKANADELKKLYHVLMPVHRYIRERRKFGIGEMEILYYAQITLKVELPNIHALYFKMTNELCEQTLELLMSDYAKQAV